MVLQGEPYPANVYGTSDSTVILLLIIFLKIVSKLEL